MNYVQASGVEGGHNLPAATTPKISQKFVVEPTRIVSPPRLLSVPTSFNQSSKPMIVSAPDAGESRLTISRPARSG